MCIYRERFIVRDWLMCDPMDCSPPGSSALGVFQARILEWVAISFSRGSSRPTDRIQVSHVASRFFAIWSTREALWPWKLGKSQPAVWASNGRLETKENRWCRQSLEASAGGVSPAWGGWYFFFPVRLLVSSGSSLSCWHFPEMFDDSSVTIHVSEGGVRWQLGASCLMWTSEGFC